MIFSKGDFSRLKRIEFERFKKIWDGEIRKIENEVMDNRGSWVIYNRFKMDALFILINMNASESTDIGSDMKLLESDLIKALRIARAKYVLENHSFRTRFSEGMAGIFRGVPKG